MTELWIARDECGSLFLYKEKPLRASSSFVDIKAGGGYYMRIPSDELFPEVTWENSPKQLIIKKD